MKKTELIEEISKATNQHLLQVLKDFKMNLNYMHILKMEL